MSSRISFILWLRDGLFRLVRAAYFSLFSRFFLCFSCISVSILHAALALYSVLLCLEGCLNIHRIFFLFCAVKMGCTWVAGYLLYRFLSLKIPSSTQGGSYLIYMYVY